MNAAHPAHAFPTNTRFFNLNGQLFAHIPPDAWYSVDSTGDLIRVDSKDSARSPGLVFTGDRIREPEFLAALAPEALHSLEEGAALSS